MIHDLSPRTRTTSRRCTAAHRAARRAIALVLLPMVTEGCYAWRVVPTEPRILVEGERPDHLRVTTVNGTRHDIRGPTVAVDTIRGLGAGRDSVLVALRDVTRVEVRRPSTLKTAALVVGVAAVVVVAVAAYMCFVDYPARLGYSCTEEWSRGFRFRAADDVATLNPAPSSRSQ